MTQDRPSRDEPEPVDADFEPAVDPAAADDPSLSSAEDRVRPPPRLRSRSATLPQLAIGCTISALAGALLAIGFNGAGTGVSTGTLAREIDALTRGQAELAARAEQSGADLVAIRARIDSQASRLEQRDSGEQALRAEIRTIAGQVSALIGAGDQSGASGSASPLGVLLTRIDRLEQTLAEDAEAPRTTRQVQRSLADLSTQIAALSEADARLQSALNSREAALAMLEAGLARAVAEIDLVNVRSNDGVARRIELTATRPAPSGALTGAASPTLMSAAKPSLAPAPTHRAGRAFAALEIAARSGRPFSSQLQTLSVMLPSDADVAALRDIAPRGAPAIEELQRDFRIVARVTAKLAHGDQAAWLAAPASVVLAAPADLDLLMQADRALSLGDLRGASEAVDGMTGPIGDVLAGWREDATRRADLDLRLDQLGARLVEASAS